MNPDKFQAILLDILKSDYANTKLTAGSEEIQVISSAELLGVTNDDKLNCNLRIDRICKFASNQLNALILLKISLDTRRERP